MGEHALQLRASLLQHAADLDQHRVLGLHAGAMSVGIDFDHHLERVPLGDHRLGRCNRVHQQRQRTAAATKRQGTVELVGRDADGIEDVGKTRSKELLGLLQGRNRDALSPRFLLPARDFYAFRCLNMGAQAHAQGRHARLQAGDVVRHARLVDQRGGGFDVHQLHGGYPSSQGSRSSSVGRSRLAAGAPSGRARPTLLCQ